MNATAHPAPETLLLFALGRDISTSATSEEEATWALLAHAEACPACAEALDAALAAASLHGAASLELLSSLAAPEAQEADAPVEGATARLSTRDAILSPTATSAAALRAAAADARAFEAPPAPALAGTARLPSGEAASIFRRPGEPPTFAIDRRELFGRAVRISSAEDGVAESRGAEARGARVEVDRFGRLRLDAAAALALEQRLARGERLAIEPS